MVLRRVSRRAALLAALLLGVMSVLTLGLFFVPFALLKGLGNCPPTPGMKWRANMYRIDYDRGQNTQWAWCPDTGGKFHNFWQFGTIVFE